MDPSASVRLIQASIDYLDRKGLGTVGLFRVTANLATVRDLLNLHKLSKPIDLNACDDPHVVAAFLLQLLRDREPSPVDFNRLNAVELPKDGAGPAAAVVPLLRGMFASSSVDDIAICGRLCGLVNKLCTSQTSSMGMSGTLASGAVATATSLASIIGPAVCRPVGSAFMSIRHKQAVPRIRDVIKSLFLHAAPVFTNLQAAPAGTVTPSRPVPVMSASAGLAANPTLRGSGVLSDDDSSSVGSTYDSPPPGSLGALKSISAPKALMKNSPPQSSPQSPSITHRSSGHYLHPTVTKALDALIFFAVRDYVNNTTSSPLHRGALPDVLELNTVAPNSIRGDSKLPDEDDASAAGKCKNPYCPLRGPHSQQAVVVHGDPSDAHEWLPLETSPGVLAKSVTRGWTSQNNFGFTDTMDSLASSMESVHLASAPVLSPSMSRRLDARRARMLGANSSGSGSGNEQPRTPPPPTDGSSSDGGGPDIAHSRIPLHLRDVDEGLEGLGVTVNSPVSELSQRLRPSAAARRSQIAKCKTLRATIRDFEAAFASEHGHQPRGPERSPLRNVYLNYRRLKQGVRENAATHIQMVYRGYTVRKRAEGRFRRSGVSGGLPASASDSKFEGLDGDIGAASVGDLEPSGPSLGSAHGTVTSFSATTSQLREEKSQLKQRLRAFDVDFKAKHGRLPSKADKEVIRHLYKRYHDVKALLVGMEGTGAPVPVPTAVSAAPVPAPLPSPAAASVASAGPESDSGELSDSLKALQREKRALQHHLRKFEEEFLKANGRKVKYQKDIVPVADDYQRYKEIKTALAASKQ